MLLLVVAHLYTLNTISNQLKIAKASIPKNNIESKTNQPITSMKPIIDLSGWQLPEEIDYKTLSQNISGAIVRVFGGSGIKVDNNAASTDGLDKAFSTHIKEFKKYNVPVAVYAYTLGKSVEEMKEEARLFYKSASPYKPTYYWVDVEEKTMKDMNKGVEAFRSELRKLGAKNIGIYIGSYFMIEHSISISKFDAVWIPAYGSDSGYYESDPDIDSKYDLHQYTSQGYIKGFNHPLDLNQIARNKDMETTYKKLFGRTLTPQ